MGIAATLVSNILLHMDGALHLSPKTVAHAAAPPILLTHRALACCVACQEDLECMLSFALGEPHQRLGACAWTWIVEECCKDLHKTEFTGPRGRGALSATPPTPKRTVCKVPCEISG